MRELSERVAEHQAAVGTGKELLKYEVIEGAEGLSNQEAKILEQILINLHGLQKEGGTLLNKINSIAQKYWAEYGIK